jgi:hypothetical protein
MNIDKNILMGIFNQIGFKTILDDLFGEIIEMSAFDTFDFSALTGAKYLSNENGVTVKGRNETFIHRSIFQDDALIYSPGLFERDINEFVIEGNSANFLNSKYPFIFNGNKKILFLEITNGTSSNIEKELYNKILKSKKNPEEYVLYKFYSTGSNQESLYEYLAAIHFINKGYIVENQVPWFQQNYKYNGKILNGGIPDFSAFKISSYSQLIKHGIIEKDKGILINKIPVLCNFKKITTDTKVIDINSEYELILGEVKSDSSSLDQAINQMKKYSDVELSNKIYSIIPNCIDNKNNNFGNIYIQGNLLKVNESDIELKLNTTSQKKDNQWLETVIKLNLLGNIDFEKLNEDLSSRDEQILGMFCIQYPIYCIHSSIIDSTKDPLDSLDKVIIDFFIAKPDYSINQVGALLGASKSLIEYRINKLIYDGHLVTSNDGYILSEEGIKVFINKTLIRQHRKSYDFYVDGISLKPLPKVFYTFYNSTYVNEKDSYSYTNSLGITNTINPFGPDIVHTPLSKSLITEEIKNIDIHNREDMKIPLGLIDIEDLSFSKLSFNCIVNVTKKDDVIKKELLDGYPFYLLSDNNSYYEAARKNIISFENNIKDKIKDLLFKIIIPRQREGNTSNSKPILISNWQEIDRHKNSENKCFSFSSEDLLKVVDGVFNIKNAGLDNIVNGDSEISIDINSEMLLNATDRRKLIANIIRKRDYEFGKSYNNVFILYIYYKTTDEFVKKVVELKKILKNHNFHEMDLNSFKNQYPDYSYDLKKCLVAAGEYDLLEKLDIKQFMIEI